MDFKEYTRKMEKTMEVLGSQFGSVRAGRANSQVLDRISVPYYGVDTPIGQVASISSPDARTLVIQPWDGSLLKPIEKALNMSELGIHPTSDGKVIRLLFPELTEEKRKETGKEVKKKGEAAKVAIRNIRRDMMDALKKQKKDGDLTEDDQKNLEEKLQKMTDDFIKQIDKRIEVKTKEVMSV
jgi:ribosome recycling factor